ncbi:phosphoglycerate mutase-like protein [Saitoella complicata NRRL Y-17804]|uniref:phosphoglycerate mutase-like protein n=1 Tax=Saitoella complicata (strain BCRC 22490 / CBS 7301 / JCM 7358 / NBRC 10748 / NRRL Y-17804) TaxID=698492 RepID=UPI000866F6A0|nr:phosphoglycerate mutase-like protein [Saitoella complicata NRRL Y-17804]ODQ52144.1 phosphoglycerate mutase-like protein [Saitoella complicata NRRL Y-17804]
MVPDVLSDPALDAADLKVVKQEEAEECRLAGIPHARSISVASEAINMEESAERVNLEDVAGPAPTATLNDGSAEIPEPPSDATLPALKDEEEDGEIYDTPPSSPPPRIPRPHRCPKCWPRWPRKAHLSIIRHAESTGNVAHLLQGRTDAPLTVYGHQQAASLASNSIFSEYPPTKVFASPLQRARHTAEALVAGLKIADRKVGRDIMGLEMILDRGLVERDLGRRENTSWKMAKKLPPAEPDNLGGEHKETFKRRVRRCVEQYLRLARELVDRGEENVHIVVVTHGLFLTEYLWQVEHLVSNYCGTNPQGILCDIPPAANASIWTYELEFPAPSMGRNDWRFAAQMSPARMNNTSHWSGRLERQRGGLGSMAYDKRQKTLDGVFRKGGRES